MRFVPGEKKEICAAVSMREDIPIVKEINNCSFVIKGDKEIYRKDFGIVGTVQWRILGPYVDLYNFKEISEAQRRKDKEYYQIPGGQIYRYMTLAEAHNNFTDIDTAYIRENFDPVTFEEYFQKGIPFTEREDLIEIDKMFGFQGTCCVYGLTKIWSEKEEQLQMHVGSTTPYKLWANGELVKEQKESHGYSPYTDMISVRLRKGENQMAVKLLRYDAGQKFTYVFREHPYRLGGKIKVGLGSMIG